MLSNSPGLDALVAEFASESPPGVAFRGAGIANVKDILLTILMSAK